MANRPGRPSAFDSPEDMENAVDAYFDYCDSMNKPYTIAGIAVWLGVDRKTIYNYQEKQEYFHILKKAREEIYASWEERAIAEGKPGQIFVMKNYGYTDKNETEQNKTVSDTEYVKARTELLKGLEKDTSKMEELLKVIRGE